MIFEKKFPKTKALLEQAIPEVFPAYAVGVFVDNTVTHSTSQCDTKSLFDLASLTKIICTTTIAAMAEQKKKLTIEESVQDFFPNFPSSKVKLSHLLNHSSGLPAWLPLYDGFQEKGFDPITTPQKARVEYEEKILKSWQQKDFEKNALYSDLGFMLLGWCLEKKLQMDIDALFQEWIANPYMLHSLQFLPISPNVLPTENCPWRKHVLRGEVHDDNCYILGGIAGHAGLFGNILDTLQVGILWLKAFCGEHHFLKPETVQKYWSFSHIPTSSRVLGWDGVSENSSTGQFFSSNSRGHLGFTGTSLWIDANHKLVVALLTNRVYPTRQNEKIKTFRPLFHDSLCLELGFHN